jgi:hypothetical protein
VWQDPDGMMSEQKWQLLLYKVSNIPEVGSKIIRDLIMRILGLLSQEI